MRYVRFKKIDEALAKETKESLTNWLLKKRNRSRFDFLDFYPYGALPDFNVKSGESKVSYNSDRQVSDNTSYALAA